MKNIQQYLQIILALSVMFLTACSNDEHSENSQSVRLKENINRDWQFTFSSETDDFSGKESAKEAKAAQGQNPEWQSVGLPHSFSLPYFRSESFYTGYGWYQKSLKIDKY